MLVGDLCYIMLLCEFFFQLNISLCFVVRIEYVNFMVFCKVCGQGVNYVIDDVVKVVVVFVEVFKGNQEFKLVMDVYGVEVVERCVQVVDIVINEGKMVQDMDKFRNMVVVIKGVDK